jgi:hypothetical protein
MPPSVPGIPAKNSNPEISFGKTGDTGLPTRVSFNRAGSKDAVTEITQWGNLQFTSLNYQFRQCNNRC